MRMGTMTTTTKPGNGDRKLLCGIAVTLGLAIITGSIAIGRLCERVDDNEQAALEARDTSKKVIAIEKDVSYIKVSVDEIKDIIKQQ